MYEIIDDKIAEGKVTNEQWKKIEKWYKLSKEQLKLDTFIVCSLPYSKKDITDNVKS